MPDAEAVAVATACARPQPMVTAEASAEALALAGLPPLLPCQPHLPAADSAWALAVAVAELEPKPIEDAVAWELALLPLLPAPWWFQWPDRLPDTSTSAVAAALACAAAAPPLLEAAALATALALGEHSIHAAPGNEEEGVAPGQVQGENTMQKKPASPLASSCWAQPSLPVGTPPLVPSALHWQPCGTCRPAALAAAASSTQADASSALERIVAADGAMRDRGRGAEKGR